MDKKIKELAKQAGIYMIPNSKPISIGGSVTDLEKFAELIIRDVLSNVWDEVQYSTSQGIANEIDEKLKKLYEVAKAKGEV